MQNKLNEINTQAALNASTALSKLTDSPVDIEISNVEIKKVEQLSPVISPEEIVAGIYLPVTGEVKGAALLIFPKETAFTFCDLLVKREPGTTRKLTELDESALKEVGNIISGSYFTVLANTLHVKITEHIPIFSFDMFGAILGQIVSKFAQEEERVIIIEVEFYFKPKTFRGYFLLLLEMEKLEAIMGPLES